MNLSEWYGCGRKIDYPSREDAEYAAFATRHQKPEGPNGGPAPYECELCGGIHLSDGLKVTMTRRQLKRHKERARRHRNRPSYRTTDLRQWNDPALLAELGPRVLGCGKAENLGGYRKRRHALAVRAARAVPVNRGRLP